MLETTAPDRVNSGRWLTAYTLNTLQAMPADQTYVLPICSLGTESDWLLSKLSDADRTLCLPPLYHEALNDSLKRRIVERILDCFPAFDPDRSGCNRQRVKVVEFDPRPSPELAPPHTLAFSVDTAVEEHGPHLPLGTDTIQSYHVLRTLADERQGFELAAPLEYGQLTWGLPFGFSIDLTAPLLTEYVTLFADAVTRWRRPQHLYVVDVHGSITHRQAIVAGLQASSVASWAFRWLHEPLAEFASERSDQHAGGVETALVELANPRLLDSDWWPDRLDELQRAQMSFEKAVELTPDLPAFLEFVQVERSNGIIGSIRNYLDLDADLMFRRMLQGARTDLDDLSRGQPSGAQTPGQSLW